MLKNRVKIRLVKHQHQRASVGRQIGMCQKNQLIMNSGYVYNYFLYF